MPVFTGSLCGTRGGSYHDSRTKGFVMSMRKFTDPGVHAGQRASLLKIME